MIRNLDYWQPANSTNIVAVNNNNRIGGALAINATVDAMNNTSTTSNGNGSVVASCNNNNEEGFGDKNGAHGGGVKTQKIVKMVMKSGTQTPLYLQRESTVIVAVPHERADQPIEIGGEETIIEEHEEEDLIEEDGTMGELVIEAQEDDASPNAGEEVIIEEQPVIAKAHVGQQRKTNGNSSCDSGRATLTPNTSTSTNSSFEESPGAGGSVVTSTLSPDHHARRPMNAFLIFCKKHRPIVREKYPNLENRAITKILGDWWANLDKKDQDPFKSLASNYKDAFLSANPNFKWYKLPAPPLRTLSTRPTNSERSYGDFLVNGSSASPRSLPATPVKGSRNDVEIYEDGEDSVPAIQTGRRRGMKSNMQFFKLADENQMGGLSHLIGGGVNAMVVKGNGDNNNNVMVTQELASDDDLVIDESGALTTAEPFTNMRTHAARMEVKPKRKLVDVHSEFQAMKRAKKRADAAAAATISSPIAETAAMVSPKSSRACKGKKYLEFIKQSRLTAHSSSTESHVGSTGNGQQLPVPQGRQEQRPTIHPVQFPHNGYCKPQPEEHEMVVAAEAKKNISETAVMVRNGNETEGRAIALVHMEADSNNGKLFDASDFELDSKIIALPALSLDTYLMRKRETKKKKKIGGKGKGHLKKQTVGPTIHEVKEALQKSAVGSQKRKARKESITRRDVNSLTAAAGPSVPCAEDAVAAGEETSGNLLILATLATEEM